MYRLLTLIILINISLLANAGEMYKLTIIPIDSRDFVNCWDKIDSLKLTSINGSTYENKYITNGVNYYLEFQVPKGKYILRYLDYYGTLVYKNLEIENKDLTITIFPDSLKSYSKDFLSEMTNSDSIIIWTEMQSCKTSQDFVNSITRINDNFYFNYHTYLTFFVDSTQNYPNLNGLSHVIKGTDSSVLLTGRNREKVNRFLNEFLVVKGGGIWTKHDLYLIRIKNNWIELIDSRNQWNGFDHLIFD